MDAEPLVSIVIPAYNSARFIAQTLDACLAQTYPHLEIIVVDDGSSDDTRAIVRAYGAPVHLIEQVNQGPAIARNTGIASAQGAYIQFCDSDDLLHPHKIARGMALLQAQPQLVLVFNKMAQIDADGQPVPESATFPPDLFFDTGDLFCQILAFNGSPLQTSTLLVRKASLLAVGAYRADPDQRCAEDWDMLLRLADRYEMRGLPEVLTYYRQYAGTLSDDKLTMAQGRLKTVVYARHYHKRPQCYDDRAYDQLEAGRHHTVAMVAWQLEHRTLARHHLVQAIHISAGGRMVRVLAWCATFVLSFATFDRLLHTKQA
ncbi:MAG: glycosyltransferase family 2 protein [Anaerolineae bacterium]